MSNVEASIRDFIVKEIMYEDNESVLGLDDPLLETGILDSAGIINLVLQLDRDFSVSIPPEDLVPENFDTVRAIAELVREKQAVA